MKFHRFEPSKTLPSNIMDYILRDRFGGIISPEFEQAVEKGDARNIGEGIDSVILNAETKTRIKLSEQDRLIAYIMAQDEVVQKLLDSAEEKIYG